MLMCILGHVLCYSSGRLWRLAAEAGSYCLSIPKNGPAQANAGVLKVLLAPLAGSADNRQQHAIYDSCAVSASRKGGGRGRGGE